MGNREITKRQQELYDFIVSFMKEHGYPPTIEEIGDACQIKWPTAVVDHLQALEKKGYIERIPGISRGIKLMDDKITTPSRPTTEVPILGRIAAGLPLLAEENVAGQLPVPEDVLGNSQSFALQVEGTSMIDAGVHDGDYVIAKCQSTADNGDMVVALIGDEATVKYFYAEENKIRLQPANPDFKPMIYGPEEVTIQGKVVAVYRFLN
jgi:repressor LexA